MPKTCPPRPWRLLVCADCASSVRGFHLMMMILMMTMTMTAMQMMAQTTMIQ